MKQKSVLAKFTGRGAIPRIIFGVLIAAITGYALTFTIGLETPQWGPILIFLGVFLCGLFLLGWGIFKLACPRKDKIFKAAAAFGKVEEIEDYLRSAESNGQLICKDSRIIITKKYIAGRDDKGSFIALTENLMWAYKHIITTNGASTYDLMLAFYRGKRVQRIGFGKDALQDCLCAIESELPYVIAGYSEELVRLYSTNTSEFIALWRGHAEAMRTNATTTQTGE